MEVQRVSDTSLKIKSKNATFLIDPGSQTNSEVLVFTQAPDNFAIYNNSLVISGPGEYEVSGVSIKGEAISGKTAYDFLEEGQKVLVVTASQLSDIKEAEEYSAIVVIADSALEEKLGEIAAEIIILASAQQFLPQDTSNFKKADKINLKKTEEYKGSIVHLSK